MKKIGNFWVPDIDAREGGNLEKTRAAYDGNDGIQVKNLHDAMRIIDKFEVAIDGGANVGSWSKALAEKFKMVYSFEPNPETFECLSRNVSEWGIGGRVSLFPNALSDRDELVSMTSPGKERRSVTSSITGPGDIPAIPIDKLDLKDCSFIKLDLEGYEAQALEGARNTIHQFRPWIMIENKPAKMGIFRMKSKAEKILEKWGYQLVEKFGAKEIDWLYGYGDNPRNS